MKKFLAIFMVLMMMLVFTGCQQPAKEPVPAPALTPEAAPKLINDYIVLATTTSTYESGLLDFLNPIFTEKTGLEVRVVSQGTGAALVAGSRGDADVLLVHKKPGVVQQDQPVPLPGSFRQLILQAVFLSLQVIQPLLLLLAAQLALQMQGAYPFADPV